LNEELRLYYLFTFVVSPKQPDTKEDNKKDNDKIASKKHIKNPFSGMSVAWTVMGLNFNVY
jgi:hypothetical protein